MADVKIPTNNDHVNSRSGNFVCGVVEGFYGRPWTTEQRKDLFQKMKKWGMDSYLYAPKDDYKHRAYWRELYTVEEADHLTGLIAAARDNGIAFYYALSPGLDISYSSTKEVGILKRKLEQVSQFGCTAFALLFDDIEPEMSESDKEVFQSFAHAQVSVSNETYRHLGQPQFMLCPTQYCAARAVPNVRNSEYLNTLGAKLAPEIDIMWTGPKVISQLISVESIEEITDVLRRPPVIWDNLHANDYDQKRVFLGPYSGRSPELIPKLRGVLTNPNCEYGANFIAIHTLAQWSRCDVDGKRDPALNDAVSADIKLETETEDGALGEDDPTNLTPNMYHPRRALRNAINDWLVEFSQPRPAWGPIVKPLIVAPAAPTPTISRCVSQTTVSTSTTNVCQLQALAEVCSNATPNDSLLQPLPAPRMNSLLSNNKVVAVTTTSPMAGAALEPMECTVVDKPPEEMELEGSAPDSMVVESNGCPRDKGLAVEDLALLCDLFYLPFEHGGQGIQLLHEFNWLKTNAQLLTATNKAGDDTAGSKPEVAEWFVRAGKLADASAAVDTLFTRLTRAVNRELLYDLYPYVWDMRGVVSLLNSYVKWLGFSKGWKESFMSGEQEPWVFRGGLTSDLQRLMPVDSSNDLFSYKAPETPDACIYTVRPFAPADEAAVYEVCRRTCGHAADLFADQSDLPGDKLVGSFLTLSSDFCFVVQDDTGIVGYALAALDARQFYKKVEVAWLPEMCAKYARPAATSDSPSVAQEMCEWFHTWRGAVPDAVHAQHPSVVTCAVLPSVTDQSVAKRQVTCLLAALRANGSFGVHVPIGSQDTPVLDLFARLGFVELCPGIDPAVTYLGRAF